MYQESTADQALQAMEGGPSASGGEGGSKTCGRDVAGGGEEAGENADADGCGRGAGRARRSGLPGTAAPRRCLRFRRIRGDIEFGVAEAAAATARLLRHSITRAGDARASERSEERHSHP